MLTLTERLVHWEDFWGDLEDRPNPYGNLNEIYTEGYHRGEDVANNGRTEQVPVLRAGEIVDSGYSNLIGYWVAIRPDADPDKRDIYCHMYGPTMRRNGRVAMADTLGRTADWGDLHGRAWGGPHLHFVIADRSHGGFDVNVVDYDPRPVIRAALTIPAPAGVGSKPALLVASVGKDIKMINIYNKDDKNEETRRAAVGEDTFEVQGPAASATDRLFWGRPKNVNQAGWNRALAGVNKRRKQKGLHPLKGIRGEV